MKIVLSINGGGILGLIPATILCEFEKIISDNIAAHCDLIAGNSTGGIIACLLCTPDKEKKILYSADKILKFYQNLSKEIFKSSILRKIITFNGLIGVKYSDTHLEKYFENYLKDAKISDTVTNLLIPAYKINPLSKAFFFKTTKAKQNPDSIANSYLKDVARATSAASSYFSPCQIGKNHTLIDGGIFANNPSLYAYVEAKKLWPNDKIILISLGTGKLLKGYYFKTIKNWGLLQWAAPFIHQASISSDETIDYMLKSLTILNNDEYFYFQPQICSDCRKLDNASAKNLSCIENIAKILINTNKSKIETICKYLFNHKL